MGRRQRSAGKATLCGGHTERYRAGVARQGGRPGPSGTMHAPWVENRPTQGHRAVDRRELWQYRELVRFLAGRDLKVRYKQAALGVGWAVVRPLVGAVTLTVVFN